MGTSTVRVSHDSVDDQLRRTKRVATRRFEFLGCPHARLGQETRILQIHHKSLDRWQNPKNPWLSSVELHTDMAAVADLARVDLTGEIPLGNVEVII